MHNHWPTITIQVQKIVLGCIPTCAPLKIMHQCQDSWPKRIQKDVVTGQIGLLKSVLELSHSVMSMVGCHCWWWQPGYGGLESC